MPTIDRRSSESEIGWFQKSVATSGESRLSLKLPPLRHCVFQQSAYPMPTINRGSFGRNVSGIPAYPQPHDEPREFRAISGDFRLASRNLP
jgi:hypothetical protein